MMFLHCRTLADHFPHSRQCDGNSAGGALCLSWAWRWCRREERAKDVASGFEWSYLRALCPVPCAQCPVPCALCPVPHPRALSACLPGGTAGASAIAGEGAGRARLYGSGLVRRVSSTRHSGPCWPKSRRRCLSRVSSSRVMSMDVMPSSDEESALLPRDEVSPLRPSLLFCSLQAPSRPRMND
jgi:hypothetical protein